MADKIKFLSNTYTESSINDMTVEQRLQLRNTVAENLGVPKMNAFKDESKSVALTWGALVKFQETVDAEAGGAETAPAKKPKEKKPKGPYVIPKSAQAQQIKRPTRSHFDTIEKTLPDGIDVESIDRSARWPYYTDGMTIAEVIEKDGCEQWDVKAWTEKGYMRRVECTDEQYAERRAAWYKKEGQVDPLEAKATAAAERAKAKEAREAEQAEKREQREAAKKEREAKKAEAEKAKKAKADAKAAESDKG